MDVNRSSKPYAYAAIGIVVVTVVGFVVVSSDKAPKAEIETEVVDDVLNNAVISAVNAINTQVVAPGEEASQTAAQTAHGIETTAKTILEPDSPEPPIREDAVMADPGPDWVASVAQPPSQDVGAPDDEGPTGALDREVIRDGIKAMRPVVEACYHETLADFPDAEGKVTLAFTIAAENDEGRVELAQLDDEKSTLIDAMLHDCMLKALGDLKFPAPEGNGKVNVRYPFNFAPTK